MLPALLLLVFQPPADITGWQNVKWGMTVSEAVRALGVPCRVEPDFTLFDGNTEIEPMSSAATRDQGKLSLAMLGLDSKTDLTSLGPPPVKPMTCVLSRKPYGEGPRVTRIKVSGVKFEGYSGDAYIQTKRGSEKVSSVDLRLDDVDTRAAYGHCTGGRENNRPICWPHITDAESRKINAAMTAKFGALKPNGSPTWDFPSATVELEVFTGTVIFDVVYTARAR
jgi:hypothetical protein